MISRKRLTYALAIGATIALGLLSRRYPVLGQQPGDALWATCVFFCFAWLFPSRKTTLLATLAISASFLVEFSQLYQAPWLNEIRATLPGRLVLGSGFYWPDLIAYVIGVGVGIAVDFAMRRKTFS